MLEYLTAIVTEGILADMEPMDCYTGRKNRDKRSQGRSEKGG